MPPSDFKPETINSSTQASRGRRTASIRWAEEPTNVQRSVEYAQDVDTPFEHQIGNPVVPVQQNPDLAFLLPAV
jgi:hypothetical protein